MKQPDLGNKKQNFKEFLISRRDEIAKQWYLAMNAVGSLLFFRDEGISTFQSLTDEFIDFLTSPQAAPEKLHDLGGKLANLRIINHRAIEVTSEIWNKVFLESLDCEEISVYLPRLLLLYNLDSGYFKQARKVILREQEQIRQALVGTIELTTEQVRQYQLHLEDMLEERTNQLKISSQNFQQITETSQEGIIQFDSTGKIIFANQASAYLSGYSVKELTGRSVIKLLEKDFMPTGIRLVRRILAGKSIRQELKICHKNGKILHVLVSAVRTQLPDQMVITVFITDISQRQQSEEALRLSENRYRTLAENARVMIIILNREDEIEYINSFAAAYLGLKREELIGHRRGEFFSKFSNKRMLRNIGKAFGGIPSNFIEGRFNFPGKSVWLNSSLVPLPDENGVIKSILVVSSDITELKDSQRKLLKNQADLEKRVRERTASLESSREQSRKLTQQLVMAQEEERRIVSRELHDETGQILVALKYELDSSFHELKMDSRLAKKHLASMMAAIDRAMDQVRYLSHSLRPPTLDVAGLNLSLEDLCEETSQRFDLPILYHGVDLPGLPEEIGISLYRILQEGLTNVWKHAHASQVKVLMTQLDSTIRLEIHDDGRGIKASNNNGGMGLLGIHERVELLGGSVKVDSQPGKGTLLSISIPWEMPSQPVD